MIEGRFSNGERRSSTNARSVDELINVFPGIVEVRFGGEWISVERARQIETEQVESDRRAERARQIEALRRMAEGGSTTAAKMLAKLEVSR